MPIISEGYIPDGTTMVFRQTTAPIGWTKNTSLTDYALRLVSGSVTTSSDSSFSSILGADFDFTWPNATLSSSQIGSHTHGVRYDDDSTGESEPYDAHSTPLSGSGNFVVTTGGSYDLVNTVNTYIATGGTETDPTGSTSPTAQPHTHTSVLATGIKYVDVCFCIKD